MRVIIAGGGTGGHVNPGVAIAKYIMQLQPESRIIFIGTERGLETKLVPREGFELKLITVRGFQRKLSMDTVKTVKAMFQGYWEAKAIIKEFKPDLVIGTGGYVCGPVLYCAANMKIPTLIHEQNAYPGVTNRILSRFVDAVAISFKESEAYFGKSRKLLLTGNPIRKELLEADRTRARVAMGLDDNTSLVVVTGGSLGAARINDAMVEMLREGLDRSTDSKTHGGKKRKILFSTGNNGFRSVSDRLEGLNHPDLEVTPYIYEAAKAYAAADLMICRAGAITCSELTALGVPSILIPSPNVTANHQEHNARALERSGAAVVILESELSGKTLAQAMNALLKEEKRLSEMSKAAGKIGITDASEKIYSMAMEITDKSR